MIKNFLILFFISFYLLSFTDKDIFKVFVTPIKYSFQLKEPIEFVLDICSTRILEEEVACTVDVFDNQMNLVHSGLYSLDKLQNRFSIILPDTCLDGNYLLNAYISNQKPHENINPAIISYGSTLESAQNKAETGFINAIPQSDHALSNFNNRFIIQIHNKDTIPIQRDFLVHNQNNLLIAKGRTNQSGIALLDIPNKKGDIYTVSAKDCDNVFLSTFSDTGFAIQVNGIEQLSISILKGENEKRIQPRLFIYIDTLLISETKLNFENQIGIIETLLDGNKLYGKLLTFTLFDQNDVFILKHHFWVSNSNTNASIILKKSERTIHRDHLNSIVSTFPLQFQTDIAPNANLSYSLLDSNNQIIKIGQTKVDNNGSVEIPDCYFFGKTKLNLFFTESMPSNTKKYVFSKKVSNEYLQKLAVYFPKKPEIKYPSNNYQWVNDTIYSKEMLPSVLVKARKKTRIQEMDEKYISNGMFRSPISRDIVVEDDASAQHYYRRFNDYLMKYIPGLMVLKGELMYRMGSVEVYVDEMQGKALPDDMDEIAYIKFIKGSLRGSNTSRNTGPLTPGSSYNVGVTAYVAVYTKKYVSPVEKPVTKIQLELMGFKN
ncbi:MAG: hypothetical protein WCP74_01825 [Sphingobacteriia bacterium]